ncbi:DbpA RNA binding domain-containing protein [Phnomibacter ginsenosidimutans]|uniref:DbpA RNA binding domain-containing protein n=1 Tax=Phnomibacter ginsenosidimutans TaxID=2676868 RepID=UPI001FED0612|nr:DbpA RNA binding domain-containing protein [Phnomibacter ginsenosidimutans]
MVGLLTQKGQLKPEDIGLITVKDFYTFVAIRKSKASHCLTLVQQQKIKGIKAKIAIAK